MSEVNTFFKKDSQCLFLLFIAIAYILPSWHRGLWIPDESRYAEISREMIRGGDWVVPHLLGLLYFEKPIAGYWINSLSMLTFGETNFSIRLVSIVSSWLSASLIYLISKKMFKSRRKAWLSAVCYLTGLLVYGIATYSVLDSMLAFWLNLMLVNFYIGIHTHSKHIRIFTYVIAGIATGMSFLTKGFLAFVLLALVALPYIIYCRKLTHLRYILPFVITVFIVCLPWALLIAIRQPDFWHYFFWIEHIQRFAADDAQHKAPFWYYIPYLLLGLLPWLGIFPATLRLAWLDTRNRPAFVYLIIWALMPFLFFSISKGKLPTYILPCFTPLAILSGYGLDEIFKGNFLNSIRANGWCNLIFGSALALVLIIVGLGYPGIGAIYAPSEYFSLSLGIFLFLYWALAGWVTIRRPQASIWPTLAAPLILGILFDWAMPMTLINSKMPDIFIAQQQPLLLQARHILASNDGMAYSLAWCLGRDDIQLYGKRGELDYGLKAAGIPDKALTKEQFIAWLPEARRQGDVALLIETELNQPIDQFPPPDEAITKNRLSLLYYRAQP